MLHKRFVVRWYVGGNNDDCPTEYCSDYTYLDRSDAVEFAQEVQARLGGYRVQINEFIADFQVPAVVIPSAWLNKY